MAAVYTFTFIASGHAKVAMTMNNTDTESEPFFAVLATNYPKALKKVIALKLPHIGAESDVQILSVQEEYEDEQKDDKEIAN